MELCKWKDSVSRPQRRVAEGRGEEELALVHRFPDKDQLGRMLMLFKRCPVGGVVVQVSCRSQGRGRHCLSRRSHPLPILEAQSMATTHMGTDIRAAVPVL